MVCIYLLCGCAVGAVAEEAISSVRTVAAFTGESSELSRYQIRLDAAKASAITAGVRAGILLGVMLFIVFCSYAVGMSYGARQVSYHCQCVHYLQSFATLYTAF
jgi:ABC-type multidrug transport system fused ATPase/permease subunit